MKTKLAVFTASAAFLLFVPFSAVIASEGTIELRNQVGEQGRCFALSVFMEDMEYMVLTTCRDLLYPGGEGLFYYILWAQPVDGDKAVRLGPLEKGKRRFASREPFQSLFVTRENEDRPRTPSGQVVMRGNVDPITLLAQGGNQTSSQNDEPDEQAEQTPAPSPEPEEERGGIRFRSILAAAGIIGFIAIVGAIIAVFVITRR